MSETALNYVEKDGRIVFNIKVVPGSSKNLIAGLYNGMIKVRISAAPEKGKANQAVIELLADTFNVSKSAIAITSGLTSKIKQVSVTASENVRQTLLKIGK